MSDFITAVRYALGTAWDKYLAYVAGHPKTVAIALLVFAVLAFFPAM
jgi:hypothetical protein